MSHLLSVTSTADYAAPLRIMASAQPGPLPARVALEDPIMAMFGTRPTVCMTIPSDREDPCDAFRFCGPQHGVRRIEMIRRADWSAPTAFGTFKVGSDFTTHALQLCDLVSLAHRCSLRKYTVHHFDQLSARTGITLIS